MSTQEYLTRHVLESFLHSLTLTGHAQDFVLKGGFLLAAYGARRPTKDADVNAIGSDVTVEGVEFDLDTINVQDIRDGDEYPGLRVRMTAHVAGRPVVAALDVSTGDPIVPLPRLVQVPRVLGAPIEILGYAKETAVAEKGVTILERGITSTRWRDYVDIVQLCRDGIDHNELLRSARAVARYRQVRLEPVSKHFKGYGALAQPKWVAWRKKQGLEGISELKLDDQVAAVAAILDPVFMHGPEAE